MNNFIFYWINNDKKYAQHNDFSFVFLCFCQDCLVQIFCEFIFHNIEADNLIGNYFQYEILNSALQNDGNLFKSSSIRHLSAFSDAILTWDGNFFPVQQTFYSCHKWAAFLPSPMHMASHVVSKMHQPAFWGLD